MDKVVGLERQVPKYKKPVTQERSKVLKETEPDPNEDPFGNDDEEVGESSTPSVSSPTRDTFASSSSTPTYTGPSLESHSIFSKKAKHDKHSKKNKSKAFNLEREKPQILQSIASSSIASTNLMNALKLIDRENKRVSEDPQTLQRFEACKSLRRQVLRYIQHIESEQWLGSLISANDGLVEALMAFEVLDKSVDDDSDSGDASIHETAPSKPSRSIPNNPADVSRNLARMNIGNQQAKAHPTMTLPNGRGKMAMPSQENESEPEEEDDDDPFGDSNAVHTPKTERPGMRW